MDIIVKLGDILAEITLQNVQLHFCINKPIFHPYVAICNNYALDWTRLKMWQSWTWKLKPLDDIFLN